MFAINCGNIIYYEIEGPSDAPVLVLANALGADITMWKWQVAALSGRFRVLRYDSRGHGLSPATEGPYSFELLAHDIISLTDSLELGRFSFCGVSLGGGIGLWLGAHAPNRVEKLVVANTVSHFGSPDPWNERIEEIHKGGLESVADAVVERWFTLGFQKRLPDDVKAARRMLLAVSPEGYIASCEAVRDADLRADLASISTPTLVIGGSHDSAAPPDDCQAIADAIDVARFLELPAAHMSNIEAAESFNTALLDFLTS